MSEMVERLARTLWAERVESRGADDSWETQSDALREDHRNAVRAILRALREPTGAQLAAFARACDSHGQCLVQTGWRAMVDAALDA